MANAARRASLYSDTGKTNKAGASILTRGKNTRPPQIDLRGRRIDIITGNFYVANLKDFGRKNEAYLELTVVTSKGQTSVAYPFKLRVDVKDKSFSSEVQGREVLTDIEVMHDGIHFQCRLTEIDKINRDKFEAVKKFVDDNDIPGHATVLLKGTGLPFNPKQIVKTLFGAVTLLDVLNDDDRVWAEMPKLDLRKTTYRLFEGTYALVQDPRKASRKHPVKLLAVGGELYERYDSDSDNEPFVAANYLTWDVIAN